MGLFDGLLGWLIAGGAAIVALATTYFGVKKSGRNQAEKEAAAQKAKDDAAQAARAQTALRERIDNDEAVRATDDPALRDRLRAYARKD